MIRNHRTTVERIRECARDVITLSLAKPEGYSYEAAQWLRLTLETSQGAQTKTFTQSSAPDDPLIEITTRLSGSAFKNALQELKTGDEVDFAGPGGRLGLPDDATKVVFLVGGVGVTPAISVLRDARNTGRVFDDALVIYGNRDEACAPHLEELLGMGEFGVRVVPVYEQPPADWSGEQGFITAQVIRRHVDPGDGRPFVVAGPPIMVGVIEAVLDELGIDIQRRIIEKFGVAGASN